MSKGAAGLLTRPFGGRRPSGRWVGAGPIHKTQCSRPAALIGPGEKGRDPRVERTPGPGEWEDPRLGGARGRSLVFPAELPFPFAGFLLSPPGWDGTSHPPRIPAPPPLRRLGAAAILAHQVEGKSQTLDWRGGGPRQGDPPAVDGEPYPQPSSPLRSGAGL